jgi:hypothetical protein
MRVVLVCRDLAVERPAGPAARVFATAQTLAGDGHEVYLLSEELSAPRARALSPAGSPRWIRVEPTRPDHRYLIEAQRYADRVWDALRELHEQRPLDIVEFPGTGAEGLTTIRAKRLLGAFPETTLAVALSPQAIVTDQPVTVEQQLTSFAEQYCAAHADVRRPASEQLRPAPARPVAQESTSDELVSVIIPLYNQGEYVRGAVDSVRANGYPNVEIVVVDDGSTDPTTISAFDALSGVVKVRQRNAGLPAARNAAIAVGRGRYIVPLDADDELPPGFLRHGVNALNRHPELAYVEGYLHNTGLLDHVQVPLGFAGDVSLIVNTHGRATGVYRRDALLTVGGYDESLPGYEDWDLHIRLHTAGLPGDVAPIAGQVYRRHHDSMTLSHTNDLRIELLQLLLRRHADALPPERSLPLLLTMAQMWKSGYEPSASVRLQREAEGQRGG